MKLLITGGAGFIGSNFIHYWLREHPDDFIVNLDALTYAGNLENLADIEKNDHYSFIHGDIRNPADIDRAIVGIDTIVHFAAESHVDRSIAEAKPFIDTNIVGTYQLLEKAREYSIPRFHHISTDEVFGSLELDSPAKFSETTPYNPRSPYAASKASSDHLVRAFFATYNLPITITNCSNNYGPYHFPEKLIPLAITNVLEGKKVPIYGDGKNVRDWLYVEDHCRAIDVVLTKGTIGETYCIGGTTNDISNIEIVQKILHLLQKDTSLIEYVPDRPGHDRRYAMDWSKIAHLGWTPQHDFDIWLEKTVEWYTTHEHWWKNVKSGAYAQFYNKQYGGIQ